MFSVDQSFGNCPQYTRERAWRRVDNEPAGIPDRGTRLTPSQRAWIAAADTFFIASGYRAEGASPTFGMDASHRGGDRGFVQVVSDTRLAFPDYAGNNHFNTIGNLLRDPRAGFLFVDFATGSLLQLTGQAEIDWDSEAISSIPGARRLVTFDIEEIVELPAAVPLRWDVDAESSKKPRQAPTSPRSFSRPGDAGPLPEFEAGQHLPIELEVPGLETLAVRRTYSLSGLPVDKPLSRSPLNVTGVCAAEGLASRHLHDRIEPGAIIDTRRPAGDFMMSCSRSRW